MCVNVFTFTQNALLLASRSEKKSMYILELKKTNKQENECLFHS